MEENISRRQFVGELGALTLAALGFGCKEKENSRDRKIQRGRNRTSGRVRRTMDQRSRGISLSVPENSDIVIPQYLIDREDQLEFKKPEGLEMSDEEFNELCRDFIPKIREIAFKYTAAINKNPNNYYQLLNPFLSEIQDLVIFSDPRVEAEFREHNKTVKSLGKEEKRNNLIEHLNKYLNAAGLYLYVSNEKGTAPYLNVYSIRKTGHVYVTDDKGEDHIPYVFLEGNLLPKSRFEASGRLDKAGNRLLMFAEQIEIMKRDFIKLLGVRPEELNNQEIEDDSLRHEATHLFIGNRFEGSTEALRKVSSNIHFNMNGQRLTVRGPFNVVDIQEICGIGAQLMRTDNQIEHMAYMRIKLVSIYQLAQNLLNIITLQLAPESELKQKILRGFRDSQTIDVESLHKIVDSSEFTLDDTRRAGEILYRLGYSVLEEGNY